MQDKDFAVFASLLSQVHTRAFGEPIARIQYSKAQVLSCLIVEATGFMLSYKSLTNYINAVLDGQPRKVNPKSVTLAALIQYATGETSEKQKASIWFKYRAGLLAAT